MKDSREEEALEVVWAMISHNQKIGPNSAVKKVAEVWKGRLSRGVQQVLMEKPLDNHQGRIVWVKWQVEEAFLLVDPAFFVKCGSFCVGEGFDKELSKGIGRVAAIAEMEEEGT